ncbi:unnamed protein product [Gulo gulo]|uniref:Uncharacterized protein n=1 Tax=Gulo gulo TaxID=48420 RepID=A0A9X9PZG6_GULGU|nr:unnamed protein product [Gulo gulo]
MNPGGRPTISGGVKEPSGVTAISSFKPTDRSGK